MGKRDRLKQVFRDLSHPSKAPTSESASAIPVTILEPRLKEPTNSTGGAPSSESQPQAAPVRDLWGLALEKLSVEEKTAVSQIVPDSKLETLRHLLTAAEKKRNDCEDRRWKFEVHGRQIILRDVADKIIVWIDKFKQIGDIAVNFDPVHASLPWAGIRFLLEMTVAESQQMGALLTGVEKMASLIGRCQIYEALYLEKKQLEKELWDQAIMNLTSALVTLYSTILSFLLSAIQAYDQRTIVRSLHAILNPAKVIGFLDKCQALENDVAVEVDNCERIHTRRIQASSKEHIQKLKQILDDFQAPICRIDSRVADFCKRLDSSERLSILEWISPICYEENHFFARQGRTNGTGEWLLQHERYCEWRASSASMILWLHGDPGAGKTKLVSTIVDDLLDTFEQLPNDEAFAYFYCDRNQPDRQEPASILSSFVRQLSIFQDSDAIPSSIVQMYNQKRQRGFPSGKLKMEDSQNLLADLLQIYPQVTLVVDALDECDRDTRTAFIKTLDTLVENSSKPVKILISSRRDRDIKHRFENGPNVGINATDNQNDIAMFVDHEINTSETFWQDEISAELKEVICHTLVARSEGMFQWVSLQIAALRKLHCEPDIRNRLGKLPKTLKSAYDELYAKIQSQEESTPIIAKRAIQWVMCSCWPLSPAELVAAVCQDPETDEMDEVYVNMNIVLDACQNLLVVDHELNVCRFSHLSVQEYFETHHWASGETDSLVGKVCLSLLIHNSSTLKQDVQRMKKEGRDKTPHDDILEYACLHWSTHIRRLEETRIVEHRLTALLKRFLGSMDRSSLFYQNWHEMAGELFENNENNMYGELLLNPRYHGLPLSRVYKKLSPCACSSFAIVMFGFYRIILDWWTIGFADVNHKNSLGESLLLLGSIGGSVSVAGGLLKKGADVNAAGGLYGNALQAASYFGQESVVRLLLEKGADVNAAGGFFGNALQAASYFGQESMVRLLLENGANINATGGRYDSALQAASYSGKELVVRLLLEEGADVNAAGGEYGSALQAASYTGEESVVRLLLENGAKINAAGGEYGSALQAASYTGQESVVRLLLEEGADVNVAGGKYGSALQAASFFGFDSVMQLLSDSGAASTGQMKGTAVGSPLDLAPSHDHEGVVQLLQTAIKSR